MVEPVEVPKSKRPKIIKVGTRVKVIDTPYPEYSGKSGEVVGFFADYGGTSYPRVKFDDGREYLAFKVEVLND